MENKKTIRILFFLLIISYIFLFKDDIANIFKKTTSKVNPCVTPITYSIGELDSQFNVNGDDFKKAIKEAEDLWENASNRNLFEYSPNGEMKVSLIYDYRQESTQKINYLDNNLKQDNSSYLNLKSQYESLIEKYNKANQELDTAVLAYNKKLAEYEKEVNAWNKNKGSREKYDQLNVEKNELEKMSLDIQTKRNQINSLVPQVNRLADQLNVMASNLNLNIAKYNNVVQTADREFEQGNYIYEADSREINIYQFESRDKLVRVLAHEMGHALGIDHINDAEDVMYSYNIGESKNITEADLNQLNVVCPEQNY